MFFYGSSQTGDYNKCFSGENKIFNHFGSKLTFEKNKKKIISSWSHPSHSPVNTKQTILSYPAEAWEKPKEKW